MTHDNPEPLATMAHVRAAGFCAKGARALGRQYGLDAQRFRATGLPVSQLEATGDALAIAVAAKARECARHG